MPVQVGDIGTLVSVDLGEDISEATEVRLFVDKPFDASRAEWSASVSAGGTAVEHLAVAGDFSIAGTYRLQVWVNLGSWSGYSTKASLNVSPSMHNP